MTDPEKCAAALSPPTPIPSDNNHPPSDHAVDASEDLWLNDFIQRLHCAVENIDRRTSVRCAKALVSDA